MGIITGRIVLLAFALFGLGTAAIALWGIVQHELGLAALRKRRADGPSQQHTQFIKEQYEGSRLGEAGQTFAQYDQQVYRAIENLETKWQSWELLHMLGLVCGGLVGAGCGAYLLLPPQKPAANEPANEPTT